MTQDRLKAAKEATDRLINAGKSSNMGAVEAALEELSQLPSPAPSVSGVVIDKGLQKDQSDPRRD